MHYFIERGAWNRLSFLKPTAMFGDTLAEPSSFQKRWCCGTKGSPGPQEFLEPSVTTVEGSWDSIVKNTHNKKRQKNFFTYINIVYNYHEGY